MEGARRLTLQLKLHRGVVFPPRQQRGGPDRHGAPNLGVELERPGGIRVQRVPSTWIIYLGLNAFKKPLSDVRVRQALNYATDADAPVKSVLDGNGRQMDGPFTPHIWGFDPSVKGYGHEAQEDLRRSGARDIYATRDRVTWTPLETSGCYSTRRR